MKNFKNLFRVQWKNQISGRVIENFTDFQNMSLFFKEYLIIEKISLKYWQWRCLCCKLNLPDIFASLESSRRQTNKVKILAPVGVLLWRYSIFKIFMAGVYRYPRITYINFLVQLAEYFTRRLLEYLWGLLIELRSLLGSLSFGI